MTAKTLLDLLRNTPEAERAELLNRHCQGQPELRQQVETLLNAPAVAGFTGEFTPSVPGETLEAVTIPQKPRMRFALPSESLISGRYRLVRKIGEGGMGEVWVAQQTEPVKRQVALKLIKTGMDSRAVMARFEHERQALAMMEHPNIAKVLDGGMTASGQPFFVMELVEGLPLTKFCDENKLTPRERLELFVPICQAVQHAHQKGIIHRDLKPPNILVTRIDGRPVPKVIDFGVAKATGAKLTDESMDTRIGDVIGTLEYMSPEQAGGEQDIDTRADIYSLGVVLYELLTGLRPIDAKRLKHAALLKMVMIIVEEEPSKPSTRLSTDASLPSVAAVRRTDPHKLTAMLRGELDWLVMKCLEKKRDRRYETANGLARDIQRYLADEPVEARPPSAAYRLQKFVRRNRTTVVAGAAIAAALVIGIVGFAWQAKLARDQRDRAIFAEGETSKRADELQKVADYQSKMLQQVDPAEAGVKLMADLRARHGAALEKLKTPEAEKATRTAAFERELHAVNATDAAVALLDRTVLAPAVRAIDTQFADQPLVDASLRTTLAVVYHKLGRIQEALALYQRSYELRRKANGEDHRDTLASRFGVGRAQGELQQLAEAESTVRATLNGYQRVLGEDDNETLAAQSLLAKQMYLQGNYEQCETITRDVLERRRRLFGPDVPGTLEVMNDLGMFLINRGNYADAVKVLREVVEAQRRGACGETITPPLSPLGTLFIAQGKNAETIALLTPIEGKVRAAFPGVMGVLRHASLVGMLGKSRAALAKQPAEFAVAEANLLEAQSTFAKNRGEQDKETRDWAQALVEFYTVRDTAEPSKGYDAKAAEWKKKLDAPK